MKVRLDTQEFDEKQRRAIRFAEKKRRTPATRDEVREWMENVIKRELAAVTYRWDGEENATVPADLAADISEEKAEASFA